VRWRRTHRSYVLCVALARRWPYLSFYYFQRIFWPYLDLGSGPGPDLKGGIRQLVPPGQQSSLRELICEPVSN
jgi:hypothetical protein